MNFKKELKETYKKIRHYLLCFEYRSIGDVAYMQKIQDVVDGVIDAMRLRGLTENTIQHRRRSVYNHIINYHCSKNATIYSSELLDEICEKQKARYEAGEISRKFYRDFVTAAFRIRSYVDTGEVNFSVVKDAKRYKPCGEYKALVESILDGTGLTKDHQYKLSITIREFFCFLENRCVRANGITDKDFLAFIPEAAKKNPNNMTCVMRALRYTAQYLNEQKLAEIKTDFSVFRPQSLPHRIISPYTQEDLIAIIVEVHPSVTKTPKRDLAIILLAFNSGLRCVDIRNLKLTDIDWKKKELRIVQKKTGRSLSAPLNGTTLNAIADYILEERPKSDEVYVFLRAYPPYTKIESTSPLDYMIDKYCRLAGVEKISYRSFHSLRRAFGTELAKAEVPVTSISQMLGHSDMSADKSYLSFNKTQTALCSADFSEVPITQGIYATAFSLRSEKDDGQL